MNYFLIQLYNVEQKVIAEYAVTSEWNASRQVSGEVSADAKARGLAVWGWTGQKVSAKKYAAALATHTSFTVTK